MAAVERRCAICGDRRVTMMVATAPYFEGGKVRTTRSLCAKCEKAARPAKIEAEVKK